MAGAPPDLRLPFQPQTVTLIAPWPVPRTKLHCLVMPGSIIPLPFFRCRFAIPLSRCRLRTPLPLPLPLPYALARRRR